MRHFLPLLAAGIITASVMAGFDVLPVSGTDYLHYDLATGEITPVTAETRIGPAIWSAGFRYINYFWGAEPWDGEVSIDWGDVAGPAVVGAFSFSDYTNSQGADGDLFALIIIYAEENGFNSESRTEVAGFLINNVPGSLHPSDEIWGYHWQIQTDSPFLLDGSDLDGDGLTDWGYLQFFSGRTPGCLHGPGICGLIWDNDPNADPPNPPPLECPGIEDVFDYFLIPELNADSNYIANFDANNPLPYDNTYWFGGYPVFSQFQFELFGTECPNQGNSGRYCSADIDGSLDCIVNLADLARLLEHYGMTTGASRLNGDVDPYDELLPGDGDVDLADLAELLSQYGDDCN